MEQLRKSVEELEIQIKENEEITSSQWNQYAQENGYYSSITMQTHINVNNWEELKEKICPTGREKNVNREIEKLRKQLHKAIQTVVLNSNETIEISRKINALANKYYKNNRNRKKGKYYQKESLIDGMYNKSYEHLKYITSLEEFPSIDEWNRYAKENNCLNSQSMQYISRYELA